MNLLCQHSSILYHVPLTPRAIIYFSSQLVPITQAMSNPLTTKPKWHVTYEGPGRVGGAEGAWGGGVGGRVYELTEPSNAQTGLLSARKRRLRRSSAVVSTTWVTRNRGEKTAGNPRCDNMLLNPPPLHPRPPTPCPASPLQGHQQRQQTSQGVRRNRQKKRRKNHYKKTERITAIKGRIT